VLRYRCSGAALLLQRCCITAAAALHYRDSDTALPLQRD